MSVSARKTDAVGFSFHVLILKGDLCDWVFVETPLLSIRQMEPRGSTQRTSANRVEGGTAGRRHASGRVCSLCLMPRAMIEFSGQVRDRLMLGVGASGWRMFLSCAEFIGPESHDTTRQ